MHTTTTTYSNHMRWGVYLRGEVKRVIATQPTQNPMDLLKTSTRWSAAVISCCTQSKISLTADCILDVIDRLMSIRIPLFPLFSCNPECGIVIRWIYLITLLFNQFNYHWDGWDLQQDTASPQMQIDWFPDSELPGYVIGGFNLFELNMTRHITFKYHTAHAVKNTVGQTDIQTYTQTDRQTVRQTEKHRQYKTGRKLFVRAL